MSTLDQKINEHFPGLVVRKDLVKLVKGNAIVPSYVLEYLLGQYCATDDEVSIQSGIETVKEVLANHYVHRNEAGLVRSTVKEKGRHKIIDKISVDLNDAAGTYEATFSNLGIKKVLVDSDTVKKHQKLLVGGVWCLAELEYDRSEEPNTSPWHLEGLKPIQMSRFDLDTLIEQRKGFSTEEWIDLLIQSIGFNPIMLDRRAKLHQLVRLVPFCERNYNLIELGPKGTGKSHIFSEFSPHGILISGGEVTSAKLFVNNASGKIGLVGYWDVVAFDEFAGKKKRVDKGLVDIMKNYMANKSFSRGIEVLGADASMVFVGNTQHSVAHMLKHSDLFDELPDKYHDSAFLDRIHFYIPGWEVEIIRGELFSEGFGFVVDYLAEVLRSLRNHDYSDRYTSNFSLSSNISTRDRDGINKTFSGLAKILYPHGEATDAELQEILELAIAGRKRVKDQLMRIDSTYAEVDFHYTDSQGNVHTVQIPEELEHPRHYHRRIVEDAEGNETTEGPSDAPSTDGSSETAPAKTDSGEAETFEGYRLLENVGRGKGGMSEAYRAERVSDGAVVFLKRVRQGSADKDALQRELSVYDALMKRDCKHILQVIDLPRNEEYAGVVTELADGGDLGSFVAQNGRPGLDHGSVFQVATALACAMEELHSLNVVHRDLKPENILLSGEQWKVADFGISKDLERVSFSKTFQQHGTPGYWAPEQVDGSTANPSADIYSFGKIVTFLLTGQTDRDRITAPNWISLVRRCTAGDPTTRPSAGEILAELRDMGA